LDQHISFLINFIIPISFLRVFNVSSLFGSANHFVVKYDGIILTKQTTFLNLHHNQEFVVETEWINLIRNVSILIYTDGKYERTQVITEDNISNFFKNKFKKHFDDLTILSQG
jgi:hypothetical protein